MARAVALEVAGGFDPDDILVEDAQQNVEAFGALYERYVARVYRYIRTRTASPEEAADMTQTVFVRALGALPRYRSGKTPFAAWLFRIARNAATDGHRRRRHAVSWDAVPEELLAHGGGPETSAIRRENLARLRESVARLDAGKRELLALRFAGGLSAREIAPIVGKGEAAVKKQLTRIIASLKEQYRDELR